MTLSRLLWTIYHFGIYTLTWSFYSFVMISCTLQFSKNNKRHDSKTVPLLELVYHIEIHLTIGIYTKHDPKMIPNKDSLFTSSKKCVPWFSHLASQVKLMVSSTHSHFVVQAQPLFNSFCVSLDIQILWLILKISCYFASLNFVHHSNNYFFASPSSLFFFAMATQLFSNLINHLNTLKVIFVVIPSIACRSLTISYRSITINGNKTYRFSITYV